jgi:protein gp37
MGLGLMADKTKIEWTDATWNPVRGCTRVSAGCVNCYAQSVAARFSGPGMPYEGLAERTSRGARWTGKVALVEAALTIPLRWKRPRRIFVNSMSDLFHEAVPDAYIDRVFAVMALAPQHIFQVLTKRPERMREYVSQFNEASLEETDEWREVSYRLDCDDDPEGSAAWHAQTGRLQEAYDQVRQSFSDNKPLPNVHLGVSVEDQASADERIPHLLATPAAVRFLSCEPLLGPVNLRWAKWVDYKSRFVRGETTYQYDGVKGLHWVIVGGESGRDARPMYPDWARSLRDQCAEAEVPFFFKQWGEWRIAQDAPPGTPLRGVVVEGDFFARPGKRAAGRLLDGVEHNGVPA